MSEQAASFFDTIKDKLPKGSTLLSALFLAGSLLIQYGGKSQHFADVQAQQDKRIADLETAVKKDLATRDALSEFKSSTDQRFNDLRDQIKSYHDEEFRFHHK